MHPVWGTGNTTIRGDLEYAGGLNQFIDQSEPRFITSKNNYELQQQSTPLQRSIK